MTWSYRSTEYISYMEVLGAEHVPQGGGGQQPGGLAGVLHVDHGVHRVEDLEIDHCVNSLCRNSPDNANISVCSLHTTVTLSLVKISWGGTSKVMVLKS